jgi:DNA invertase Pin-like site-specific DNA recombinase
VLIYLRVSTEEQATSGLGLAAQLAACSTWAEREGRTVAGRYSDEGITGAATLDERPGLLDAIASLERGDVLLVAKRDRLGRGDPVLLAMIESAVARKGCRVVSAAGEGTDDDEPSSILMRRLVDAFAEYERLIIKARTRAALSAKARRGERISGRIPYGRDLAADGKTLVVNVIEEARISQFRSWSETGSSPRQIAWLLNARSIPAKGGGAWNESSVRTILKRYPIGVPTDAR